MNTSVKDIARFLYRLRVAWAASAMLYLRQPELGGGAVTRSDLRPARPGPKAG